MIALNLHVIIWHADENQIVYWASVSRLICVITNVPLVLTPELALLNIGSNDFPRYSQNLITHILLVARLAVIRYWKSNESLSQNEVITLVHTHITCERHVSFWYGSPANCGKKLVLLVQLVCTDVQLLTPSPPSTILFTFCSVINYATLVELLYPSVLHLLAVDSLCHLCLAIHFSSFLTFILFEALLMKIERENLIVYDVQELGHQRDTHRFIHLYKGSL